MGTGKYPWLLGKLFALAFVFVGGGILAAALSLWFCIVPGGREERVQRSIGAVFRFYLGLLQFLRMLTFTVEGRESLAAAGGKIVVANHPSLLDVVALMALVPRAQCIVKHQLWRHRFLGALMRRAGYIRNDLEPQPLVAECRRALAAGRPLIVFPEGTRSVPGRAMRFHRGFANIAILAGAPILPVVITCKPVILYKGEPWWRVPSSRPVLRLAAGDVLAGDFRQRFGARGIAARRLVEYLERYYREKTFDGRIGTGTETADHRRAAS
jgi:1-acyl-sn-glycerol-3-phosphate acyltransferase